MMLLYFQQVIARPAAAEHGSIPCSAVVFFDGVTDVGEDEANG
jgi:hypothetical protein